jgi:ABC-type branched-subunit amino acid transport system ATPase component
MDGQRIRLQLHEVRSGYGPVTILRDLNFALPARSVSVLLGPNGAGKSTMCQTIVGMLPVTAGRIELDGVDISGQPCWWRARQGIFLAPEGRGIFPTLSVDDNLRLSTRDSADRDRIYDRFANLAQRRRVAAGSLSGGEQQMLALSPVLVNHPDVLIVDEPTLGLAPLVADQVLSMFSELRDLGTAVLLVGESPRGLADIADTITLLHGGRTSWSGAADQMTTDILEQAYFDEGRV